MILFNSGFSDDFDGPGTRLVFYLKGCNFRCAWCASPESISPVPELLYTRERSADRSGASCPKHALSPAGVLDRSVCRGCGTFDCVRIWHNPAFELAGETVTPEEILRRVLEASGMISGVTFGGGEPTLQSAELLETCRLLRRNRFHVALESNASTPHYREFAGKVDLLFSDLKTLDPEKGRRLMNADLSLVAENLRFAAANQKNFRVRIPVVSGLNDDPESQRELLPFLLELKKLRKNGILEVELLRQHHLGEPKYRALGIPYPLAGTLLPDKSVLAGFSELLNRSGISAALFG